MGHEINYITFDIKKTQKQIQNACDDEARYYSDSRGPLYSSIRFIDKVFDDYDSAYEYIDSHDDGNYCQLAVKYKDYKNKGKEEPKSLIKLRDDLKNAYDNYNNLSKKYHFAEHKAALISCSNCGSKIASKYMKNTNYCPVCITDMRPKSTLDRIESAKKKWNELQNKYKVAELNFKKKAYKEEIKYLVKIEYHV